MKIKINQLLEYKNENLTKKSFWTSCYLDDLQQVVVGECLNQDSKNRNAIIILKTVIKGKLIGNHLKKILTIFLKDRRLQLN